MTIEGGEQEYDFVVLGGGSAGTAAAAEAVRLGHERVLVVNDGELGGLCILAGCMPTKTLLHTADVAFDARHAASLGLDTAVVGVRMDVLQERRRALVERFQRAKIAGVEASGYEVVFGRARFEGAQTVAIQLADGAARSVRARAFLVATGSKQRLPQLAGLLDTPFWTSEEALLAERVPESIAVLGAGAVGLEFASLFAALGSTVTVLTRSAPLHHLGDPALSAAFVRALEHCDMQIVVGATATAVRHDGRHFELTYWEEGHEEVVRAERLLIATGRTAALDDLGLEEAGVRLEDGAPVLDPSLCSTNPRVFFAGDAGGDRMLLHTGNQQGRHVARNLSKHARDERLVAWSEHVPLSVVFTHPPFAECGLTELAAREAGHDVVVAQKEWARQGRGIVMDAVPDATFVKLVALRPSSKLLGCQILGPRADDIVHVISTAMHLGGTARDLLAMPWYHPTLCEGFLELARDLVAQCDPVSKLSSAEAVRGE